MFELMVERIKRAAKLDGIILATTDNPRDDGLEVLSRKLDILYYRGSEDDVLNRVLTAAQVNGVDHIVELWGDNVLIDPVILDAAITFYRNNDFDCVGTTLKPSFPLGMSTLIFSTELLKAVDKVAVDPVYREHVSNYIYTHQDQYSVGHLPCSSEFFRPDIRLTVDEPPDFELVSRIFQALYPVNKEFGLKDIIKLLDTNPELIAINKSVKQRRPVAP